MPIEGFLILNNIEAKLVYVVVNDRLNLSWNFNIVTTDHKNWYDIFVSTEDERF